ncbi:MAG: DNA polymerase ligase N-terminal domain-containing protein [Gammaproteobacteria bacterium]|nr:DNA polymerase ligase N-terminal domain-containing protein [Gammaproteobacteria bacterium]
MAKKRDKLTTYRSRRDFRKTPEPSGDADDGAPKFKKTGNPIFVVQQHDARSMHWDFRIEVGGVLRSWAVPKGPSTNPKDKRLAVATEDHPLDYADFEGCIPEDEYGGGAVIVWDAGPYRNLSKGDDGDELPIDEALARGQAEIWLEGKKIRGGYALVHSKLGGNEKNWLLIKMKDAGADARRNPIRTQPGSVLSGRTVAEVAASGDEGSDR